MINIIGNFFGTDGYSVHTRQLASALNKLTEVRLSIQLPQNWPELVNDDELKMIKRQPKDDEISLIITTPHTWKLYTTNQRNWAYCIFEGDKVPTSWIKEFLNPDIEYILVASEHTKQAIHKTLFQYSGHFRDLGRNAIWNKIKIIPHGVNPKLFYPVVGTKNNLKTTTTFLFNKGFRNMEDRGGAQYLIQAYLEEFTNKDNVELLLKINPAYGVPDLNQIIKQMGAKQDSPKIRFITDNVPYNKMVEIYQMGNVFVSPTRAEAFNIPCIEAMACGLPVITTNFGGQTDYCNKENSWIISGKLTKVTWEMMYEEIKWLTPDLNELRKAMREAYSKPELVKQKRIKAIKTAKQYSWENGAKKICSLI